MAIYRLLQNSAFGLDNIGRMVAAYESALKQLGLRAGVSPLNETIAQYVIEIAQTGEKDPAQMCRAAIERLAQNIERLAQKNGK